MRPERFIHQISFDIGRRRYDLQSVLANVGYKGGPKFEQWGAPTLHPIPGINVPLRYYPHLHNITVDYPGKLMR